jgi:glucose/arabinose dehydrogenase
MHVKNSFKLILPLMLICCVGCANNGIKSAAGSSNDSIPTVETKSPNSDYKPAFRGQTRIAAAKTTTPYAVEKIAGRLGYPFAIVAMPDGRLMVTLKSG